MAATKRKHQEGNTSYCYDLMQKIHDAILFGSRTVKQVLSLSYYSEMDSFLTSFKEETADAQSHGNVDEKKADQINFTLFCMILIWAIDRGNILAGCGQFCSGILWPVPYLLTLWHCTTFQYQKIILSFIMTQQSQTKNATKFIAKRYLVTHRTLSYVQVSACWVSDYRG